MYIYNAYTHKLFWFWVARVFGSYRRGLCAPWQVSPPKSKKASALIVRSLVLGSRQAATSDKGHVVTTQSSAKILEFWTSNHHFEVDETFQILFPFISGAEGTAFATEWSTQESLTPAVSLESDKAFSPRAPGWEQSGKMWENCAKLAGKISDFLSPLFMTWFAHEPLRLRRSALLQWAWRASSVWQEDNLNSCRKLHLFFFWSLWCNRGLVARLPLLFLRLSRCDPSVSQCVYKEIVAHFFCEFHIDTDATCCRRKRPKSNDVKAWAVSCLHWDATFLKNISTAVVVCSRKDRKISVFLLLFCAFRDSWHCDTQWCWHCDM